MNVLDWLLDSDPAIRWQVLQDLVHAPADVAVFPKNSSAEEIQVHFTLQDGSIRAEPWPFSVERYSTFVIGYAQAGYPETLDPIILPVELTKVPGSGTAR